MMIEIIILKIYRNSTLNPNSDLNPVNAFRSLDPFHPVIIDDDSDDELITTKIHLWLKQRNARKTITTIEGLNERLNLKLLASHLKKTLNCNGNVDVNKKTGCKVIRLTGDQREKVSQFLQRERIANDRDIIIHGY